MSGHIPVTWHLRGDVNSHEFTLVGAGTADLTSGTTELALKVAPSFPDGFDPALSHLICNFALAGYTAVPQVPVTIRDAVHTSMFVRPRRQVIITDGAGEQISRLEALTTMEIADDGISITNHMTGFSRLPAAVLRASGEETLVPGPVGTATGIARYTVELQNGEVLDGMTVVPYQFDRQDVRVTPARRIVGEQSCEWVSVDELKMRSTSQWQALSVATEALGV